ncbi:MAG: SpoIIE family protein phosphatase [Candidatus Latescibacteria bacterium]|jgi:phosphoserine phosphatase RsbU/P|nr:SpoIIE family protein phosphatase [Candidatus Latescibacterota bacterium]
MPYLNTVNEQNPSQAQHYQLSHDITIIGRSNKDADMVIAGDGISRKHAQIRKLGGEYLASDLGSHNGTFHNNRLIDGEIGLSEGDHLRLGQTILVFTAELSAPPDSGLAIGADDSEFQGTMFKADELAVTMIGSETTSPEHAKQDYLQFLAQLSKDVMAIPTEQELADTLTGMLLKWFQMESCAIVYAETQEDDYTMDTLSIAHSSTKYSRDIKISRTALRQALENRMAWITGNAMQELDGASIIARNIVSIMCAPLWHDDQIFGILYLDTTDPLRRLDVDHLRLLSAIANLAAIKIDQLRLFQEVLHKVEIEKELELAGEIQSSLLPGEEFFFQNLVCAGAHEACEEVGGDYYDYVPFSDEVLTVTIADVTGHGPSSAFLMVACKSTLTALIEAGMPFDDRMDRLNAYLVKHCQPTQFITFFHAEIDLGKESIRYCNAGHNAPILAPRTGDTLSLMPKGPPLGIMEMDYEIDSAEFLTGTKLVMYTDGITEASNPAGDLFEDQRLFDLVTLEKKRGADDLKSVILENVTVFSDGTQHLDDVTLSIVEST